MITTRMTGLVGALALVLMACPGTGGDSDTGASTEGASSGSSGACEPGEEITCACTDGSMGTQTCNADGSSFGECECGPGEDTSGGMGGTSATTSGDSSGSAEDTTAGTTAEGTTSEACMPGTAIACEGCPDGPGFQYCNDQGELGECRCCEGVHPLVDGDLRYCEEGWCYCGNLQAMPPVDVCFELVIAEICCPGDITLECY